MPVAPQFYATDAGRAHFANQLTSIRYCVQETCNFDVLYAYLVSAPLGLKRVSRSRSTPPFASQTCGNYDFSYDKSKNLRAPPSPLASRAPRRRAPFFVHRPAPQHPHGDAARDHDVRHRAGAPVLEFAHAHTLPHLSRFGVAQKEGLGLDKAVEECKFRMSRYGVTCASWPRPATFVAAGR